MPYLGNVPAEAYTNTVKDSFNGDASTTAFTLSQPSTTNNLRVVVENVIQDPTVAYTVSGTTLTFTSAPPVGTANIYAVHLGPATQTAVPPSEINNATNFTDGITVDKDGAAVITADRASSDGTIIDLQKSGTSVGSIGAEYSTLNIDGGSGAAGIHFAASSLTPRDNGAYSDAGIDLGTSSYRFRNAHLSGGVVFDDAGGSGTPTSYTLDSYEEGTWTPACANGTITSSYAKYTKVGRLVTVSAAVGNFSDRTSTSAVSITGLPFTSLSTGIATGSVFGRYIDRTTINASYVSTGASSMTFYDLTSANWAALKHSELNSSSAYLYFTVTYFAA